ncbi:MAG: thermonuclease family protein [Chromatiales bacterium]
MRSVAGVCFVVLVICRIALATEFHGSVVTVLDGDSLVLLLARQEVEVRLAEIDAPEQGQPYSDEAAQALRDLVLGKQVRFVVQTTDDYGRLVARVYTDASDVNATLVLRGAAWVYRRYLKEQKLLDYEQQARNARRGLWALAESERVPPWEWRAAQRGQERPAALLEAPRLVIANKRSRAYHLPGCPSYDDVAPKNQLRFRSAAAAEAAGFQRAGNCPLPASR